MSIPLNRYATAAALALPMMLAMSQAAFAYDPCHRAMQEREAARNALNTYYANNCTWSYDPRHCRNPQRGYELERDMQRASQRAREACN